MTTFKLSYLLTGYSIICSPEVWAPMLLPCYSALHLSPASSLSWGYNCLDPALSFVSALITTTLNILTYFSGLIDVIGTPLSIVSLFKILKIAEKFKNWEVDVLLVIQYDKLQNLLGYFLLKMPLCWFQTHLMSGEHHTLNCCIPSMMIIMIIALLPEAGAGVVLPLCYLDQLIMGWNCNINTPHSH